MKEIMIFQNPEFGQIRIAYNEQGEPLFCLKDVCQSLLLDGKQVVRRLNDEVVSKHPITDSLGRVQKASFVNEDGLYDVILESRKPEAKAFRKWVTGKVLPQIRKTGGYIPVDREDDDLTIMAKAYQILQRTISEQKEQLEESRKVIEDITPMAEYAEQVLLSPTCYTMTQVAKSLSMTVQELQLKLQQSHVIYRSPSGCWMLYAEHLKLGYEAYRTRQGNNHEGDVLWTDTYLVWTERGKEFIHQLVKYERNI